MAAGNKTYLVAILVQSIYAGLYLLSKAAFNGGMNTYVFVFYRQAAATVFLAPVAIIFERKRAPPLSFVLLFKIFMLALCGITFSLNMYGVALKYTSATVASATTNSVPVITFLLAVLLRMETLKLKSLSGTAKVLGLALCLGGIMTIAFYDGPHLKSLTHHHYFTLHQNSNSNSSSTTDHQLMTHSYSKSTWIKGSFLMIISNAAWSLWLVLQGRLLKEYPSKLLFTTLQCLFSTIQSFVVAVCLERDISRWKLDLDVGLLAVGYCGIVVTGVSFYLQAWCIEKKGPVFLVMFTPLGLVITIFFSSLLLGELVSLGSVLGGLLMVGGLYSVLWGKRREQQIMNGKLLPTVDAAGKEGLEVEEREMASPFHPL